MAAIDSVYNYYLSTYGASIASSRYDTHKKSELRDTYNKIIKSNKDSPLYKINLDDGSLKEYAIDLKETARSAQTTIAELSADGGGLENLFHKKVAVSSNPDSVDAEYIGDDESDDTTGFTLGVKSLATPQVNTGNYLNPNGHDFEAGTFTFDLDTTSNSYEFQFTVENGDTNIDTQNKIARLVNNSDIGLTANVLTNDRGQTALQITSKQTGLADSEEYLFKLSSGSSWNELNRLGIANVDSEATNSVFTLNGKEHSSLSNTFTINKAFEITLKAPSDSDATIGFKANTDAIADGVEDLLHSYNSLLDVSRRYGGTGHNTDRLYNEVTSIASTLGDELSSVGINTTSNKTLELDRTVMTEQLTSDNADEAFTTLNKFRDMLSHQAEKVSINPMNYVDKLIVEYKNPYSSFSAPYAQSQYAGLILNKYL